MSSQTTASQAQAARVRDVFNYYLKLRGMKKNELAERCGYDPQTIYNMLSNGCFSEEAAKKISNVLRCTPEELRDGVLRDSVKEQISDEKKRLDLEIVSDERLFMRTMILSQQRTIENLSFIAKETFGKSDQ